MSKHPFSRDARYEEGLDLDLNRRDFLKLSGGVFVFFALVDLPLGAQPLPTDFNAFLKVGEDGRVTCFTGKIEMGQGIVTSLAQMIADELDVSLDSVDMVMGDTDLCPWDRGTWGSLTTRRFGPALHAAGAEARQVLLELASDRLGIPLEQLTVENGVVFCPTDTDARVTYAELTKGKRIERHLEGKAVPKDPSLYRAAGKAITRRDARVKLTGEAEYAADIQLPGMLYARILRPPTMRSFRAWTPLQPRRFQTSGLWRTGISWRSSTNNRTGPSARLLR
ncbi:MAG: molybdopterin-dependent oxidoreductase [Candidatus Latescibacteria bacterium]|jgi:isoquinoline 1-oxidoreductase|nr:molybdopterin-dependent oxidoreductase [Candidatus Latescibacterota bacterium]